MSSGGCPRWPDWLRLESTLGLLVPGRCRASNLCDYCAKLAAVETSEVLALDALTNFAPTLWTVLTTRTATFDVSIFKHAREVAMREVRRRWPLAQCATLVEFTSGYGSHSGGQRRPHWNDAWKGIPSSDADELLAVATTAWRRNVDCTAEAQSVRVVNDTGGLMRYLSLHFQKESQQPPTGWRGHRFRTSRGYLAQPMADAREQARASLRLKREIWKAEDAGLCGSEALEHAHRSLYEAGELAWTLVRLQRLPTGFGADGLPISWREVVHPC